MGPKSYKEARKIDPLKKSDASKIDIDVT